ncbi:hypothetical protein EC991_003367 [Linnemannia zychae]|nr:hypothetical protein EC991_003367 [Linnemannia zychae]
MTVARLAAQPTPSPKAMRTSTTNATASVAPKQSLRLSSSSNNKGKGSPTPSTEIAGEPTEQQPSTTSSEQALPLFTPIWDYDRFPIGPCVRENNRSSQEQENPFLMLEYHQQNQRPQSNVRNASAVMMRSGSSSSSASSTASAPSSIRHKQHGSRSSSRHGSRNLYINSLGKTGSNSSSPPSPSLATDPSFNYNAISPDLLLQLSYEGDHHQLADLDDQKQAPSTVPAAPAPAPTSKFDLYKAQMDRVRSSHRLHMHGHGRSASASASPQNTTEATAAGGQLPFPSTPSSSVYSPPAPSASSPTTIYTSSPAPSFVTTSNKHRFPKLFKKPSLSINSKSRVRNQPSPTSAQPSAGTSVAIASPGTATVVAGRNGSKSSLVTSPHSRRGSRSAVITTDPLHHIQRSPLEEQQDRWREEWLRPSGAIHSMFRDTPSKFNCPHCGAMKVVSNIQFVPGLMSYLVAFGLMFLTLGTLSYLPFRKDHEGTKDCIHWCPECEQRVARTSKMTKSKLFDLRHQLLQYATHHNNPVNVVIHLSCIPLILWTALVFAANTGPLLPSPSPEALASEGVVGALARVVEKVFEFAEPNLAWGMMVLYVGYYFALDFQTAELSLTFKLTYISNQNKQLISAPLFLGAAKHATTFLASTPDATRIALYIHAFAWIAQFIGHGAFEKRAPKLLDNLVQALVLAPYFVVWEVLFMVGYRSQMKQELDVEVRKDVEAFRARRAAAAAEKAAAATAPKKAGGVVAAIGAETLVGKAKEQ